MMRASLVFALLLSASVAAGSDYCARIVKEAMQQGTLNQEALRMFEAFVISSERMRLT